MSRFVGWYDSVRVGTPPDPDPALYEKLSEEERMLGGWPYKGSFPVKGHVNTPLDEERFKAQQLFAKYNDTKPEDLDLREEILGQLLHESCKGKTKMIEPPFVVDYGSHLKVGDNFYCNFGCLILDSAMVEIGNNCLIGPGVHIYTACHPVNPEHRKDFLQNPIPESYQELAKPVKIGHQCWIGGRSVICPGVTIGDNVTIGAGSVVTKDVPDNVVVGGNPAKIIRYLDGAIVPHEVMELQKKYEKKPQPSKK